MSDIELPELPEPGKYFGTKPGFSAEQLCSFARAAVEADRKDRADEWDKAFLAGQRQAWANNTALRAEVEKLQQRLRDEATAYMKLQMDKRP